MLLLNRPSFLLPLSPLQPSIFPSPIVTLDYLADSAEAGEWLATEDYSLVDKEAEVRWL